MGGKMCQNNNNNSIKWTCDYDSDIMARLEFNPNNIAALKLYLKWIRVGKPELIQHKGLAFADTAIHYIQWGLKSKL